MDKQKHDLMVFGFGLGVLIPYLVMLHGLEQKLGFIPFVLGFIALLVLIAKIQAVKPLYFLVAAVFYGMIIKQTLAHGIGPIAGLLTFIAFTLLLISIFKLEALLPLYKIWMKLAHGIGTLISGLILCIMFYLVFAPVGIVLRLMRKDLMDQNLDPNKKSYWILREAHPFDPKHYHRQF